MREKAVLEHATLLIAAGVETATTLVATTLLHLHQHPSDRDALLKDRDLIRRSCDEFVRFTHPSASSRGPPPGR